MSQHGLEYQRSLDPENIEWKGYITSPAFVNGIGSCLIGIGFTFLPSFVIQPRFVGKSLYGVRIDGVIHGYNMLMPLGYALAAAFHIEYEDAIRAYAIGAATSACLAIGYMSLRKASNLVVAIATWHAAIGIFYYYNNLRVATNEAPLYRKGDIAHVRRIYTREFDQWYSKQSRRFATAKKRIKGDFGI